MTSHDGTVLTQGGMGIGTWNPISKLHVEDDSPGEQLMLGNSNPYYSYLGMDASNKFRLKGGDQVTQLLVDFNTGDLFVKGQLHLGQNLGDLAENFIAADPSISPGDVVAADSHGSERIVLSVGAHARATLGVVSTRPGALLNSDAAELDPTQRRDPLQRPLALAGRVPVKVTLEGGPIHPGDPLTTSSTPGHAMRAKEPWRGGVIGTALTPFDGNDEQGKSTAEGRVIVFLSMDRTATCDPEEQVRLTTKVGELERKLSAEREARLGLETRMRALEEVVARHATARSSK
jgi:hypothetical protein